VKSCSSSLEHWIFGNVDRERERERKEQENGKGGREGVVRGGAFSGEREISDCEIFF
jgi:hypothetical protein